jgi:hypothetical protein
VSEEAKVSQGNRKSAVTEAELEKYSAEIGNLFRKQVPNVVQAAALFCEAREKTKKNSRWKQFKAGLQVHKSTVSKLGVIGKNEHLRNPEVQKHLPCHPSTLYYIARKTPVEIDRLIEEGKIHPAMQRKDIEPASEKASTEADSKQVPAYMLELEADLSTDQLAKLEAELNELGSQYGFKVAPAQMSAT